MTWGPTPDCIMCKWWIGPKEDKWGLICEAFPDGIPESILLGAKHNEPVKGDHGIRFEFDPEWKVKHADK